MEKREEQSDVFEKLVELIEESTGVVYGGEYGDEEICPQIDISDEEIERIADRLVSHGVTVQELNGCEYCEEYEDLPEHFFDGKPVGRVFDTCIQTDENGLWHLEVPAGADIGIRFCPMCGRRLPQPPKGE